MNVNSKANCYADSRVYRMGQSKINLCYVLSIAYPVLTFDVIKYT